MTLKAILNGDIKGGITIEHFRKLVQKSDFSVTDVITFVDDTPMEETTTKNPEIVHVGVLDTQVCVPKEWMDEQVIDWTERMNPAMTTTGWHIRKEGNKLLAGYAERVPCAVKADFVHIMLDV